MSEEHSEHIQKIIFNSFLISFHFISLNELGEIFGCPERHSSRKMMPTGCLANFRE